MRRIALAAASAILLASGVLALLLRTADPPLPGSPADAPPTTDFPITVRGRLIDAPGFPARRGILARTRVSLRAEGDRSPGDEIVPEDDGTFLLEGPAPPRPDLILRVSTRLQLNLFDRTLDRVVSRDIPVRASQPKLGDVQLPRSEDFGSIDFQVVDQAGAALVPQWIGMDAVEGTSTPDVGIARLDELDVAANAPTEYSRGGRGAILHVPPGEYWLRAMVLNHLMPPLKVRVGRGPTAATIAELASARRIRGVVRRAGGGGPLEDVEITVASANYAGAGSRDPARVLGRTSRSGTYDLPLPDPLPPGGVKLFFVRAGYRSSELDAKTEHFKGGTTLLLDLDLGRD